MNKPYVLMTPAERLQTPRGQYEAEQARLGWPDREKERERRLLDDEQHEDYDREPRRGSYTEAGNECMSAWERNQP